MNGLKPDLLQAIVTEVNLQMKDHGDSTKSQLTVPPKKYVLDKSKNLSFDRHLSEHTDINDKAATAAQSQPFKHVPVLEEETTKHEQKPDTKIVTDTIKLTEKQNQHKSAKEEIDKNKNGENTSITNKMQTNIRSELLDDAPSSSKDYIKIPKISDTQTKINKGSLIETQNTQRPQEGQKLNTKEIQNNTLAKGRERVPLKKGGPQQKLNKKLKFKRKKKKGKKQKLLAGKALKKRKQKRPRKPLKSSSLRNKKGNKVRPSKSLGKKTKLNARRRKLRLLKRLKWRRKFGRLSRKQRQKILKRRRLRMQKRKTNASLQQSVKRKKRPGFARRKQMRMLKGKAYRRIKNKKSDAKIVTKNNKNNSKKKNPKFTPKQMNKKLRKTLINQLKKSDKKQGKGKKGKTNLRQNKKSKAGKKLKKRQQKGKQKKGQKSPNKSLSIRKKSKGTMETSKSKHSDTNARKENVLKAVNSLNQQLDKTGA